MKYESAEFIRAAWSHLSNVRAFRERFSQIMSQRPDADPEELFAYDLRVESEYLIAEASRLIESWDESRDDEGQNGTGADEIALPAGWHESIQRGESYKKMELTRDIYESLSRLGEARIELLRAVYHLRAANQ